MEKIQDQHHDIRTVAYAISRMLERASYYGIRAMVVIYMTGEIPGLNMSVTEALNIFGWFTGGVLVAHVLGALFGDLFLGNKKTLILGGIIQAIGAFTLCWQSTTGLYLGLGLVALGGGLYSPNVLAHYGKLYLNKTKLLDAAFTLLFIGINVGSFAGIAYLASLGEQRGWHIGFIAAGVCMILSVLPPILLKEPDENDVPVDTSKKNKLKHLPKIILAIVLVGLFWMVSQLSKIRQFDFQNSVADIAGWKIPDYFWSSASDFFGIPLMIILAIVWSYFYSNQFVKLTIGFIAGAVSIGLLCFIPEAEAQQHFIFYALAMLFIAIAEIHISPITYSILTKYSNPKYLAIIISVAFIPTRLFIHLAGVFNEDLSNNPSLALYISLAVMVLVSIALMIYLKLNKNIASAVND